MMITRGKAPQLVAGVPRTVAAAGTTVVAVLACVASLYWLAQLGPLRYASCEAPLAGGSSSGGPRVTPFSLPPAERLWAYEAARMEVPTLVTRPRRLLTLQLALAALLGGVPGDFVETGVFRGGTSILMMKALERHDPSWGAGAGSATSGAGSSGSDSAGAAASDGSTGGSAGRCMWAADSFQGTPAPVDEDQGGEGLMRSG